MRDAGIDPHALSRGTFADMYWTVAQLVTHHSSNGCNLRPGDLLGSGTVSGTDANSIGCLLEMTFGGRDAITLANGEPRRYLQDEDEVTFRAHGRCQARHRLAMRRDHGGFLSDWSTNLLELVIAGAQGH